MLGQIKGIKLKKPKPPNAATAVKKGGDMLNSLSAAMDTRNFFLNGPEKGTDPDEDDAAAWDPDK